MLNMTFQQLSIFMEVAKRLNITAVAEEMYISQAAVSKMIQRLETNLEIPLLDRSYRNIRLTPQGKLLYNKLQAPFDSICDSIAEVQNMSTDKSMLLRIGYPPTIDMNYDYIILNKIITKYKQRHPEIVFEEGIYSFEELKSKLKFGNLDLIFIPNFELYNDNNSGIDSKGILRFQIFVTVGEDNPAIQSDTLNLKALRKQPLYKVGNSRSDVLEEYIRDVVGYDVDENGNIIILPNMETVIRTLKSGYGFAILGKLHKSGIKGMKFYALSDMQYTVTLHAAWRANDDNVLVHRLINSIANDIDMN